MANEELPVVPEDPIDPDFTVDEPIDLGMQTYGVIGYVTLEEANQYVLEHYMTTEVMRQGWDALENEDRAALLRRAFMAIELLPFSGHKTDPEQDTAFPRCSQTEIPRRIKYAQIEQALMGADPDATEEAKQYEKMWQWGVSSYRIGNLSESISTGTYGAGALRTAGITSAVAARYLTPFMQGGYRIR